MRRLIAFFAKAFTSILLFYLSLRNVNLASVAQRLSIIDLRWMAFTLCILCVQMPLVALRWREVVLICNSKLPSATALRFSLIGQFFSQALPSTVGGDAVRIWLLARWGAGWATAVYSVLIDRIVGVSVLALLVVACLPWTFNLIHDPVARVVLGLIGFGVLSGTIIFLMLGAVQLRALDRWWLTRHLVATSRVACRLCHSASGLRVVALSLTIHLMTVTVAWGAAMAAHATVDFAQALILVLPVLLIATIPVSIAGWGVRESAMVLAFSYAGLAASDGLIVSVLFGAANLIVGALGAIVWVAGGYKWRLVKVIENESLAHARSP